MMTIFLINLRKCCLSINLGSYLFRICAVFLVSVEHSLRENQKMCLAAAEKGTGLCISTAGVKTLRFLPPLVITKEEVDTGLEILESILS